MPKYRIRKDGREFGANRLETLRELAVRGLLHPEDGVSVGGGSFRPAASFPQLAAALERGEERRETPRSARAAHHAAIELEVAGAGRPDPFDVEDDEDEDDDDSPDPSTITGQFRAALHQEHRAASAHLNRWADDPTQSGTADADSVLEAFLADLGSIGIQNLTDGDVEVIGHVGSEPPEPGSSFEDEIPFPPPTAFDGRFLRQVAPEDLSDGESDPFLPLSEAPTGAPPPTAGRWDETDATDVSGGFVAADEGSGVRGLLSFQEPATGARRPAPAISTPAISTPPAPPPPGLLGEPAAPATPLSFEQWMQDRDGSPDALLSDLGRVDEFLRMAESERKTVSFSLVRVFGIFLVGLLGIGVWWFTVQTGANRAYPTEDELASRVTETGATPRARVAPRSRGPVDRDATPTPGPRVAETPSAEGGSVPADQIERDARLRARVGSEVTDFHDAETLGDALFTEFSNLGCMPLTISVKGRGWRGEPENSRPTLADVEVVQRGLPQGPGQLDELRDRLSLTWLVLGKYAERGKVSLDRVVVKIEEPSKYHKEYQGARLAAFYQGTLGSKDLFFAEQK